MTDTIKVSIQQDVPADVLENIFVTAIEGGSNYWYHLDNNEVDKIRKAVPKDVEPSLSVALFKAVYNHGVTIAVHDKESYDYDDEFGEILGELSMTTMANRLQKLVDDGNQWALIGEINEHGDAESSDAIFQYLVMGEVVFS